LDKRELIRKINKGAISWNAWKKRHDKKIASVEITEYSSFELDDLAIDLSDYNFKGKNLSGYDFSNAIFLDTCFVGANLSEADFSCSYLTSSDLSEAKLNYANFENARLDSAVFNNANLSNANLSNAVLDNADLCSTILWEANLTKTNLSYANLWQADLWQANMEKAILENANLHGANLKDVNLTGANLCNANLKEARLIETNIKGANLTGCKVFGVSAWNVKTDAKTNQSNLIITKEKENIITIDNLKVAQFIYLILENKEIRDAIDTITSKVVLILGRFTKERKVILELLRKELRKYRYIPVLFDFEKPKSRNFIETVSTLAHLSKFVIVDLTDAKIVLEELPEIVKNIAIPIKPLFLNNSEREPTTISNLRKNHKSILNTFYYSTHEDIMNCMNDEIITPAEKKYLELNETL